MVVSEAKNDHIGVCVYIYIYIFNFTYGCAGSSLLAQAFPCCSEQALEHSLSSCDTRAYLYHSR